MHLNAATVGFIPWGPVPEDELTTFSDAERARLARKEKFLSDGNAYFQMQATRPQTIGYALADSPVGQLAWAVDRMAEWVAGPIEEALSRDQILTNVMFYWITGTPASAARLYYENMHAPTQWGRAPSPVPVGVAAFATDLAIRRYGEQSEQHRPLVRLRARRALRGHGGTGPARSAMCRSSSGGIRQVP